MSLKKRRLCSCRLFVSNLFLFFLFLEKMVGIPMQKVSYIMLKVDAEIANIFLCCSVFYFLFFYVHW